MWKGGGKCNKSSHQKKLRSPKIQAKSQFLKNSLYFLHVISRITLKNKIKKEKLSGIFHLNPLYQRSTNPKWKAFFPNQVQFSNNFEFLRQFLRFSGKINRCLKTPYVPFLYSKRQSRSHSFNTRIGFKNRPPMVKTFEKKQNGVAVTEGFLAMLFGGNEGFK